MSSVVVVTPTYNERENLKLLAERIFALNFPNLRMIVVDDNSPDGTGELAEDLAKHYPIQVVHRDKKLGLGTAYAEVFRALMSSKEKTDYIIQMDADLSHDPDMIPHFLEKIKEHDLVLGSRYVAGGKIENWDFFRRAVSRFGNLYARFILNLPITDLTSGFKCYRKEALEAMNFNSLSSIGYNFQIETTYKIYNQGFRISEIPICFTERKLGVSKFHIGIILESFLKVFWLRLHG